MTSEEFVNWMDKKKLTNAKAAFLFYVSPRTITRWKTGRSKIPKVVEKLVSTFA